MSEYVNELRDSARQVVTGQETVPVSEAVVWPLTVELGWLLTTVPEELDGLGMGIQEVCALHSELGRGLIEAPFVTASLVVDALCKSELDNKAELVARFAMGECATCALTVPTVTTDSSGETLSGKQAAVLSADTASHVMVWTSERDCVALVALEQPGVTVTHRETWDITRRLYEVDFDQIALEQEIVLARGEAAEQLIAHIETARDFALAADAVGAGSALLEQTVEYLNTRKQFGRPLALFQALKHRCADMKVLLAGAESLLTNSLGLVGNDLSEVDAIVRAKKVKYLACSAFMQVAEEALQLHGGIGMAVEHPCHLYLKRAMLNEQLGEAEDDYPAYIADEFLSAQA